MRGEHIEEVTRKIRGLCTAVRQQERGAFRLQINFGSTLNEDNFDAIMELEEEMHSGYSTTLKGYTGSYEAV